MSETTSLTEELVPRFLASTRREASGCLIWTGANNGRYGSFSIPGRTTQVAHRVSHELFIGTIPAGYQVDHLCRVRLCVEPGHLEAVTQQENNARSNSPTALNARKTCCPRGHAYTPENTYSPPRGGRYCLACKRERERTRRETRRDTCPECGKTLQSGGTARHLRRMHPTAALVSPAEPGEGA